jgi:hypothetical protein
MSILRKVGDWFTGANIPPDELAEVMQKSFESNDACYFF